jgi:DNA-binding CsgD family transcriptional regulator
MDQVQTNVFVVASPQIAATAITRAIRSAGWPTGVPLSSPRDLADIAIGPNDVIVLTENTSGNVSGAATPTVISTLRNVFPTVGLVLISVRDTVTPCDDPRTKVLPGSTSIASLSRELTALSGEVANSGYGLTARHLEILQMIAKGASTDEAGAILGIASKTVNNHLSAAYQRLGTRSLTQAVLVAARAGLIDPGLL